MPSFNSKQQTILSVILVLVFVLLPGGCSTDGSHGQRAALTPETDQQKSTGTPRLAVWLAKKNELLTTQDARYDLVMSGWFESHEAQFLKARDENSKLLAGLSHTWIMDDPDWLEFLITIANGGDVHRPLQVTPDMYLMLDKDQDGSLDSPCSPPGWQNIKAVDPRHLGWQQLILSFYTNTAVQSQHDGVVIDMLDAYPFCEGAWSGGVTEALDATAWVAAQAELLRLLQKQLPEGKWMIANAGHDFSVDSPFPQYLNGYLLENFLGSWGANLEEGLASAQRALESTRTPHLVIFAVDTDDNGEINWARFRSGLATSLLLDNTYFAFDYGSRDHGGVAQWWFVDYYSIDLENALGAYIYDNGIYRRDFKNGTIVIVSQNDAFVQFIEPHQDVFSKEINTRFDIPQGDAGFFLKIQED